MINFEFLEINHIDDYDILHSKISMILPNANHNKLVRELKDRINLQTKLIVIEFPYRDFDFSSVYSYFYSKKHLAVSKDCIRLHFFANEELENKYYIGNIVVRDSVICSRGRAVILPKYLLQNEKAYIVQSKHTAHLMGKTFFLDTYAWMSQDTDIAICAHVAVWSINNYYATKYSNYSLKSIGQISEIAPLHMGRKTPSNGLNLLQISDMFSRLGFYPLVLQKE